MADAARRREMDRLRRLAIEGDDTARRKLEKMEAESGRTQPGGKPVGAGRTLRRPEPLSKQELEARRRARHPEARPEPGALRDVLSRGLTPEAIRARQARGTPAERQARRSLEADIAGAVETGDQLPSTERMREAHRHPSPEQEAGLRNLERIERGNAAIDRETARQIPIERRNERLRQTGLDARATLHERNLRTLEERGAEQDPARAREILNRNAERVGIPGLRTPEERKIAHGTYSPSDPTGLEGRMLGLAPEEPEPRRLTARERSQLGQGIAGEDLIDHAIATGQFDRSNLGFAAPGTENERGVRYEEGRDIPGATRVMGPRQARLEDLLSGAEEMDFTGDTAGAAAARAEVQGIRDEQAADMERQRNTTRRSRNARGLTSALSMRERSRPGGVDVSADEQAMIEGMTPAQRDRLTLKRATARGRGRRDMDQRERHRQAWNAEALRRNPDLLDSIGGKPMSEYQRATLGLQRDRLSGEREDRRGDEEWRRIQYQESVRKEADATRRGDKAEADRERKWQFDLEKMAEERERYRTRTETETTRYREGKAESKLEREAREAKEKRDGQIALERMVLDDDEATPSDKKKARDRLRRLVNREPLEDTLAPGPAAPGPAAGPSPATPTAAEVPEGYEDDRGYAQQQAAMSVDRIPPGPSPERDRQNLVIRLRENPADEQQMLRDLYSTKWKPSGLSSFFGSDSSTWAEWAKRQYVGYTEKELAEFYKMEAPEGDDPDDWHDYWWRTDMERSRLHVLPESKRGAGVFVPRSVAKRAGMSEDDETWTWSNVHKDKKTVWR